VGTFFSTSKVGLASPASGAEAAGGSTRAPGLMRVALDEPLHGSDICTVA